MYPHPPTGFILTREGKHETPPPGRITMGKRIGKRTGMEADWWQVPTHVLGASQFLQMRRKTPHEYAQQSRRV